MPGRKEVASYQSAMRRPSHSEYDDAIVRYNKRTERSLKAEHERVDHSAKVRLGEHVRKQNEFQVYQAEKLRSPGLWNSNLHLDDTLDTEEKDGHGANFKRDTAHTRRVSMPARVGLKNEKQGNQQIKRRSSVWEDLSVSKHQSRTLEIRRKVHEEFSKAPSVAAGTANKQQVAGRQGAVLVEDEKLKQRQPAARRVSAPSLTLTDKLSDVIEERLSKILAGNTQKPEISTDLPS